MSTRKWQRFSVSPPTGKARKIELGEWDEKGVWDAAIRDWNPHNGGGGIGATSTTYWREYDSDPPPDDRTQRELDRAQAKVLWMSYEGHEIVLRAMYQERQAIRALLKTALWPSVEPGEAVAIPPEFVPLIQRLDEQGDLVGT